MSRSSKKQKRRISRNVKAWRVDADRPASKRRKRHGSDPAWASLVRVNTEPAADPRAAGGALTNLFRTLRRGWEWRRGSMPEPLDAPSVLNCHQWAAW